MQFFVLLAATLPLTLALPIAQNNDISPDIKITDVLNDLKANVLSRRALLGDITVSPDVDVSDLLSNANLDVLKRSLLEDITVNPDIDVSDILNDLDLDVLTRAYVLSLLVLF